MVHVGILVTWLLSERCVFYMLGRFAKTTNTGYQCQKNRKLQILDLSQNVRCRAITVLPVPPSGHILIANAFSDVVAGFPASDEQDIPKIVLETFLNSTIP